jgi:hypothetical protein
MDDTTPFEERFDARVRAFATSGVRSVDSASVARAAAAGHPRSAAIGPAVRRLGGEIPRTRQRAADGPWRTRSMLRAALSAAAVVAILVVGGALLTQHGKTDVAAPSTTPEASASPSQPAVVTATPTPTAEVLSLDLTWTKVELESGLGQVAWLGDRFVLVDAAGAVSTSIDGASWHVLQPGDPDPGYVKLLRGQFASWEDDVVGWWNPEYAPDFAGKPPVTARDILQILRPPAQSIETTPFKGRIESLAIGPNGIVAQVHSDLDWDAWVTKKLGVGSNNQWVKHLKSVDFRDGILQIKLDNGPGLKVVWADEGFEPGDYQDRGFGWYSPDGEHWTEMAPNDHPSADFGSSLPTGTFGNVVGVSDGFIANGASPDGANGSCCADRTGMWYSSDGLTWRLVGTAPSEPQELLPWRGGALVTDGVGRFDFWTSEGYSELPMATEVPTPSEHQNATVGTGPLDLVTILQAG